MSDSDAKVKESLAIIDALYPDKESSEYINITRGHFDHFNKTLDERITLDWLRLIPAQDIPFERIEGRYGKPDSCGYSEESFAPYCTWKDKGILVSQSDNRKKVIYIEYVATDADVIKHLQLSDKQKTNLKPKIKNKK